MAMPMRVSMITTAGIARYLYPRPTCPTSYVVMPLSESWCDQGYPSLNRRVVSLRVFFGTDSVASISDSRDSREYGIVKVFLPSGVSSSIDRLLVKASKHGDVVHML
jgi:hypothetical protein